MQELIEKFAAFYRDRYQEQIGDLAQHYPRDQSTLFVDYADLARYDQELADDYLNKPKQVREAAEAALRDYDLPIDLSGWTPDVRLSNVPDWARLDIGHFRTHDEEKIRQLAGQVVKRTDTRPRFESVVYECQRCAHQTTIQQSGEDLQEPYQCESCERQGPFKPLPEESEKEDFQKIRVQTPPEEATNGTGADIDILLRNDLVDEVDVGDRVKVSTYLQVVLDESTLGDWQAHATYLSKQDKTFEDLDIDDNEERIKEIAAGTPFEDLVGSVNPSHYGDEDVKLAIALQLFGGVRKELPDGTHERGDSHLLLIGDAGVGKSKMLQWARVLSPRSVYTSGKSASGAGLTAAAMKDDFGDGAWTIEGGALVKANKGVAAIDEFDKMDEDDRSMLFEALAEQTISVSKAGMDATLPARTRVLAAANPALGRFDKYQPISEQIDLDPAMISRFDLIFPLKDTVDAEKDEAISQHSAQVSQMGAELEQDGSTDIDVEEADPVLEPDLVRAYIAYARQEVTPVLSDRAVDKLTERYLAIRQANDGDDDAPVPTTMRTQKAILRLAEASARIRLSETVAVEDVERAADLVFSCLKEVGVDPETDQFDADVVETGRSKSQKDRLTALERIIQSLEDEFQKGAPVDEVLDTMTENGFDYGRAEGGIDKLKDQGKIYEPSDGHLRMT